MCRDPHYCTLQSPTFSLPPPNLFECHPPSRMNSILYSSVFFGVKEGTQPQKDRTSYRSNKGPRPPLHLLTKKRELWWGRWQLVQNPREEYAPISKIICNNVGFPINVNQLYHLVSRQPLPNWVHKAPKRMVYVS